MRDFKEITQKIKLHLSQKSAKKILDKDVANALKISQSNYATIKRRNSIPYKNILIFCKEQNFCCKDFFFKE